MAMVNLIAGRRLVPELLNDQFTPEGVRDAVLLLLADGELREEQIRGLDEVRRRLMAPGAEGGVDRVARVVRELFRRVAG